MSNRRGAFYTGCIFSNHVHDEEFNPIIRCTTFPDVPINLLAVTRPASHDRLQHIRVEQKKIFRERSTCGFSWTFVTRSCPITPMTAGSKSCLTDNLRILSIMLLSSFRSLPGSTRLLESLIVSTCSSDS